MSLARNQPPWSRSPGSETPSLEKSEQRRLCTKEFLNPKRLHSVGFKDPSNDAHQAITAEQMAFFSTQFIYKRLSNEAILEVSHPGGGRRLVPVSFDPINVSLLEGKVFCVMRRRPGLEGRLASLSFLSPGLESVGSQSL